MKVCRRFKFDAAHRLPEYEGVCSRLHGHTWFLDVEVCGDVSPKSGFVIDFAFLKEIMKPLLDTLDHHYLNEIISNPTCENLTDYIWFRLSDQIRGETEGVVSLSRLRLYESPDSYAEMGG
jgi:6-pyruvoyltetrahydropterin/6-carboxytetrahydropterin synthase